METLPKQSLVDRLYMPVCAMIGLAFAIIATLLY